MSAVCILCVSVFLSVCSPAIYWPFRLLQINEWMHTSSSNSVRQLVWVWVLAWVVVCACVFKLQFFLKLLCVCFSAVFSLSLYLGCCQLGCQRQWNSFPAKNRPSQRNRIERQALLSAHTLTINSELWMECSCVWRWHVATRASWGIWFCPPPPKKLLVHPKIVTDYVSE